MRILKRVLAGFGRILLTLLTLYTIFYLIAAIRRPARSDVSEAHFQGVTYHRIAKNEPRALMLHVMAVDLSAEGVEVFVTPPDSLTRIDHSNARKTTEFSAEFDAQVAMNASFFYTFTVGTPLTFYPETGEPVTTVGLSIADGVEYSADDDHFKTLCFLPDRVIVQLAGCPDETRHAVSGNAIFLRDGQPFDEPHGYNLRAYGRAAVAIDETGQRIWLIVIDNKQWGYSNGVTLLELADIAQDLGAQWAINLDGGGSSTLVSQHSGRPRVLNSPVHTGLVGRERPVANHIGVRALPLNK